MVNYKLGDWIYIIKAESGARGADGLVGQVVPLSNDASGVESHRCTFSIRLLNNTPEYSSVWNIGDKSNVRLVYNDELPLGYRSKDDLSVLIKLLNDVAK